MRKKIYRLDAYSFLDIPAVTRALWRKNNSKFTADTMISCYYTKLPRFAVGKNIVAKDFKSLKKKFPEAIETTTMESVCRIRDIDYNATDIDFNSFLLDVSGKG